MWVDRLQAPAQSEARSPPAASEAPQRTRSTLRKPATGIERARVLRNRTWLLDGVRWLASRSGRLAQLRSAIRERGRARGASGTAHRCCGRLAHAKTSALGKEAA